ncbi:MAG: hypothetical protein HY359_17905 [Candidatus Rokubacteria bacterium]|nr:hypothetical protein [Candidatus Rokubacteria bacterium]
MLAGRERVVTDRFQILTPHYGGLLWYDATGRWVKGSFEIRGEWIDYAFGTAADLVGRRVNDPREMVHARNRAPLHPGAARYYRERGWLPQ